MPIWIRYAIEIVLILLGFCLFLYIAKKIGCFLCFILQKILGGIISGIQYLLILPFKWSNDSVKSSLAGVDEKLNLAGNRLIEIMQRAQTWFKGKKIVISKRQRLIVFVVLFIATILPEFQAIQSLNDRYRTIFCIAQNQVTKFERALTPRIDEYPELFKEKDEEEDTEIVVQEIYLQLNQKGENGANVRRGPSLDDESIIVVNSENTILYLGEKQYDGTRYWLKVKIDDTEINGWLSGNLVQTKLDEID